MQDSNPGIVRETERNTGFVRQQGHIAVAGTEGVRLDETAKLQGIVWKVIIMC